MGTCLPCIKPNADSDDEGNATARQARARNGPLSAREELERLLDEPITDHEDVETMSLHSNVGRRQQKKPKKKNGVRKSIRVFGVDLFGRRGIALPDDEEEEEQQRRQLRGTGRPRAISTSTLDSDAAPLGDEAIIDFTSRAQERWEPVYTDEQLAAEENRERERLDQAMRKERKKDRKEMKRLAALGAFDSQGEDGFEGFPGSGSAVPPPADEFGPFVGPENGASSQAKTPSDQEEEDGADFDAAAYTKKRRDGEGSRSGSGTHSRSHSRTSASLSNDGTRTHRTPRMDRSQASHSPIREEPSLGKTPSRPGKSKKSKRSKSSVASSSATQSLPSPVVTPAPDVKIHAPDFDGKLTSVLMRGTTANALVKGVPGGFVAPETFPSTPTFPSTGFPSTGFGGFKRSTSGGLTSGAGVALARRGDD